MLHPRGNLARNVTLQDRTVRLEGIMQYQGFAWERVAISHWCQGSRSHSCFLGCTASCAVWYFFHLHLNASVIGNWRVLFSIQYFAWYFWIGNHSVKWFIHHQLTGLKVNWICCTQHHWSSSSLYTNFFVPGCCSVTWLQCTHDERDGSDITALSTGVHVPGHPTTSNVYEQCRAVTAGPYPLCYWCASKLLPLQMWVFPDAVWCVGRRSGLQQGVYHYHAEFFWQITIELRQAFIPRCIIMYHILYAQ